MPGETLPWKGNWQGIGNTPRYFMVHKLGLALFLWATRARLVCEVTFTQATKLTVNVFIESRELLLVRS